MNAASPITAKPPACPIPSMPIRIALTTTHHLAHFGLSSGQPVSASAIQGPATGIRRSSPPGELGQIRPPPNARLYQAAVVAAPSSSSDPRALGGGRASGSLTTTSTGSSAAAGPATLNTAPRLRAPTMAGNRRPEGDGTAPFWTVPGTNARRSRSRAGADGWQSVRAASAQPGSALECARD